MGKRQRKYYLVTASFPFASSGTKTIGEADTIAKAKALARAFVFSKQAKFVDVIHRTRHGDEVRGVMKSDGWSAV